MNPQLPCVEPGQNVGAADDGPLHVETVCDIGINAKQLSHFVTKLL